MFVNNYASNIGQPTYIKQILKNVKGENDDNSIIIEDFNTPLTSMDSLSRQRINKETSALNNKLDQMDLIDT